METLKPGTKCKCNHTGNAKNGRAFHGHGQRMTDTYAPCQNVAVRLVTVRGAADPEAIGHGPGHAKSIPMCQACSDYHERSGK